MFGTVLGPFVHVRDVLGGARTILESLQILSVDNLELRQIHSKASVKV